MKELNRRAFLKLSGAAAALLALAACGGGSSAPAAPSAPTGKEAELVAAINKIDLFASVVQDDHMVLPTVSIAGSFQRQKAHQKS